MALDEISQTVWRRAPDYARAVMMAPYEKRGLMFVFLAMDIDFYHIRHHLRDENLADLRLAWWKNAVQNRNIAPDEHQLLRQSVNEGILEADILALLEAYQNHQESFPILLKIFARHLDVDEAEIDIWLNSAADSQSPSQGKSPYYNKNQRPLIAMIHQLTPWQRLRLHFFGRY